MRPGTSPLGRLHAVCGLLLGALLLALATQVSLQRIRSFDYWQHLRTGALIAETGRVPQTDPYTYSVPGARWVDPHWLHQLGLHQLHSLGGHEAVVLGKLALVLALLALLAPIGWRRARPATSVLGLALLLVVASDRIMPRPELPTFVLLGATLLVLDRWQRHGGRGLWWLVPLQLLWVNLHGLFAVGLAVIALMGLGELLRPLPPFRAALRRERVVQLAGVLAAGLAVSLLNPNGLDALLLPLRQLAQIATPGLREAAGSIGAAEFVSPLRAWRMLPPLGLAFAAGLGLFAASGVWLNRRDAHPGDVLLVAVFGALGLAALRNWGLFAVVAAPLGIRHWNAWLDARRPAPRARLAAAGALGVVLALVVGDAASGRFFDRIGSSREAGLGVMRALYPIEAAEWIARERPPGPLFHHMADGAYLIWRLYPDTPVLLDGRLEQVFRPEDVARLHQTRPEGFDALDRDYHFGSALLHFAQFDFAALLRELQRSPRWRLVHADGVAVVFVREPAARRWPALDPAARDFFSPIAGERGPSDRAERIGRARLLELLGRPREAGRIYQDVRRLYPDSFPPR